MVSQHQKKNIYSLTPCLFMIIIIIIKVHIVHVVHNE